MARGSDRRFSRKQLKHLRSLHDSLLAALYKLGEHMQHAKASSLNIYGTLTSTLLLVDIPTER